MVGQGRKGAGDGTDRPQWLSITPRKQHRDISDCSTHIMLQHTDEKDNFVLSLLLESLIASINEDPHPVTLCDKSRCPSPLYNLFKKSRNNDT